MSGENFGRCNAQSGAGPGANDRYAYSGDGGATGANGANAANDRYNYSGDGHGQATGADNSSDCNWRPDYSYSSPHARAWLAASKEQATKPINRDDNGAYAVQFGDSLSGIAARELRDEGQTADKAHIKDEMDRIVQANDQQYRSLDCNRDLIKVGWQLQIPRWAPRLPDNGTSNQTGDNNGDNHPQCVQRDQGRNYYDQSDQPRTTVFNIQNAYFYGDGRGGFSMQPGGQRGDQRQFNGGNQYDILLPNQGDQYEVAPRNTSIPPVGLQNGYGWNRGACVSCGDNNNGVYFTQPQGYDNGGYFAQPQGYDNGVYFTQPQGYDNGYYWPGQQGPNIVFGLNLYGGERPRYFEPPHQNWNWQNGRNFNGSSGNWHQYNNNNNNNYNYEINNTTTNNTTTTTNYENYTGQGTSSSNNGRWQRHHRNASMGY
jgi:hypothetical protein